MELEGLKEAVSRVCNRFVAVIFAAAFLGMTVYAQVDVRFASTFDAINKQSDGSDMDTSFTFALGTFEGNFMPTDSNTDLWLDNWVTTPNDPSNTGGGSEAQYSQTPLPFATITGASNRYSSSSRLDGNPVEFTSSDPAYVWGYNNNGEGGAGGVGEWILLTNPSWLFPTDTGGVQFGSDFLASDAGTVAVIGSVNPDFDSADDAPHLVSGSVLLPVPEPSVALLLFGGVGMLLVRRRR